MLMDPSDYYCENAIVPKAIYRFKPLKILTQFFTETKTKNKKHEQ